MAASLPAGDLIVAAIGGFVAGAVAGPLFRSWVSWKEWSEASRQARLTEDVLDRMGDGKEPSSGKGSDTGERARRWPWLS